jgi:hypothetical protein
MRTQFLCALAILCGAEVAHAQGWGTNAYYNNYTYPASYQAPGGYDYSGAYGSSGYYPTGYGYNYYNGYPYYNTGYYYPEYTAAEVATAPAAAAPVEGVTTDVVPEGAPLVGPIDSPNNCRFWLAGDYLMSWVKQMHVNYPLVTIGGAGDAIPGAVGQPGTAVLVDDNINMSIFSGFKIEGGVFLDDHRHFSVEAVAEYFGEKTLNFNVQSDSTGNPIISRPVFNVLTNTNGVFAVTGPLTAGIGLTGGTSIEFRTEIYSTELNATYHCCQSNHCEWDWLAGFRYVHLGESLDIVDRSAPVAGIPGIPGPFLPFGGNLVAIAFPSSLQDQDNFRTNNNFYGLQFGGKFRWDSEWVFVKAYGKIALGANSQAVDIAGLTTMITPTGNTSLPGGILALPSNSGHHTQTVFSIVPEGGISIGVNLTHNIQVMAGYSCLFWTQVVRPGSQIDAAVNGTQVPSSQFFGNPGGVVAPTRPLFAFNQETLWVQSLTFGMQFQY